MHVVNNELNKRITELEKIQGRKLEKIEKLSLKDDVIATLIQQAFSKYKQTALFIDVEKGLIYVDASSHKQAEDVLALLRKTLGSLPVVPLTLAKEPCFVMTSWVTADKTPEWLDLQGDSKLIDFNSNGEAVLKIKTSIAKIFKVCLLLENKFNHYVLIGTNAYSLHLMKMVLSSV